MSARGPVVTVGVDVGATKIAFGLVTEDGQVIDTDSVASKATDAEDLWGRLEQTLRNLVQRNDAQVRGVGIGSAGPIDVPGGTVSPVNIGVWRGFPLVARLSAAMGTDVIGMRGDAVALAHAEHRYGAGRGAADMLGLVVSTGIGGGLILGGRVFDGVSGNAGFFGHTSIRADGDVCACGRRGCVEAYASGPQMVRRARAAGWVPSGAGDFIELAASARAGDDVASRAIADGARSLAVAITNVLATLDIRRVVIGGGVSRSGPVYWDHLEHHMQVETEPIGFLRGVEVRAAEVEGNPGILGAALAVM